MAERIRVSSAEEDKRIEITLILRRYRSKVAEYQACRDLYNQLFPSGTQTLSDMPAHRSDSFEPERWAQRRWDQRSRMEQSLQGMLDALTDVERMLDVLEGDYKTVLIRRYLLNESYETIAERLNYSDRQIYRMHNKAINLLVKKEAICRKL